jgi:DNA mismatch repair protein MutL
MPKINLLDKSVYELIAAGEVIERPASVIKELAENSIDAGAHTVTVEIKRGGITYIRVSDDGCGIAYEDIPTAFLRHATSKVSSADDLESINTLGFRGEALASVCAVGKVELISKRAEDKLGTSYRIEGGETLEYDRIGCSDGTSIIIRDIFFNTPARLKFLKKDVTEGNYCAAVIEKLALSHPGISFRFIRDGRQTMITSGDGAYYSAVYAVFGKQFAAGLVPVENVYRNIGVVGYASSPLFTKANRSTQLFFVNGRSVKSPLCCAALEEAYRNSIMTGRFPACVLCINLDPALLDANISPAKTEVRFSNEKAVFDAIYVAVKNGLMGYDESREIELAPVSDENAVSAESSSEAEKKTDDEKISTMPIPTASGTVADASVKPILRSEAAPFKMKSEQSGQIQAEQQVMTEVIPPLLKPETVKETPLEELPGFAFLSQKSFEKRAPEPPQPKEPAEQPERTEPEKIPDEPEGVPQELAPENDNMQSSERRENVRVIGELFKTYIICESGESLLLIDKHAAHERINFERFRKGVNSHGQFLLEPKEVYLAPEEYEAVSSFSERLANVGLLLKFSENGKVIVEGMPQYMDNVEPDDLLQSIAQTLAQNNDNAKAELFDEALHMMACKASIRANEDNDITELSYLADRVINDREIRYCPHGRPVLTQISKRQIEKYFGRIV